MIDAYIQVKPSVKRFLTMRFGNPIRMDQRSFIGKYFNKLMLNGTKNNDKYIKLTEYTEHLHVLITYDVFLRYGSVLTPSALAEFNTSMEELIQDFMVIYLDGMKEGSVLIKTKKRLTSKDSYDSFLSKFGFNQRSFTYDAVKKANQRHRIKVLSP